MLRNEILAKLPEKVPLSGLYSCTMRWKTSCFCVERTHDIQIGPINSPCVAVIMLKDECTLLMRRSVLQAMRLRWIELCCVEGLKAEEPIFFFFLLLCTNLLHRRGSLSLAYTFSIEKCRQPALPYVLSLLLQRGDLV